MTEDATGPAPGGDEPQPAPDASASEESQVVPGRRLGRWRRENVAGGRKHSHRVYVTPEEEALLLARAVEQRVTVPRLLVESALTPRGETPSQRRAVIVELFALRRQLAGVAGNLNQLTRKANAGNGFDVAQARQLMATTRASATRIDAAIDDLSAQGVRG